MRRVFALSYPGRKATRFDRKHRTVSTKVVRRCKKYLLTADSAFSARRFRPYKKTPILSQMRWFTDSPKPPPKGDPRKISPTTFPAREGVWQIVIFFIKNVLYFALGIFGKMWWDFNPGGVGKKNKKNAPIARQCDKVGHRAFLRQTSWNKLEWNGFPLSAWGPWRWLFDKFLLI